MLYACVQKFDVMGIVEIFFGTKHAFTPAAFFGPVSHPDPGQWGRHMFWYIFFGPQLVSVFKRKIIKIKGLFMPGLGLSLISCTNHTSSCGIQVLELAFFPDD